jgi:hypothetical protein
VGSFCAESLFKNCRQSSLCREPVLWLTAQNFAHGTRCDSGSVAAGLVACCPLHIEISHVNNARRARNLDLADGMSITPTTSLPERDLCGSIGMLSPRLGQKNAFAPAKYSNQHEKEAPTFSQPHLLQICNTGPCLPAIEQLKGRTGACIIIPRDLVMSYCHHQFLP